MYTKANGKKPNRMQKKKKLPTKSQIVRPLKKKKNLKDAKMQLTILSKTIAIVNYFP